MKKIHLYWKTVTTDKGFEMSVPASVAWAVARAIAKDQNEIVTIAGKRGSGIVFPGGEAEIRWADGEIKRYGDRAIAVL